MTDPNAPSVPPITVHVALAWAAALLASAGVEPPRFEAALLLAWAIRGRREDLIRDPDRVLTVRESLMFNKAVGLRCKRRPLAYITGEQWFYGRAFKVNRAVLIPRPETEMLVDFAIERAGARDAVLAVADIGTGSGCIAVSVACELIQARVVGVDLSVQALHVARKNNVRHGTTERVGFVEGDLLTPLTGMRFDLILSNPPYIAQGDIAGLMPEVGEYEPPLALYAGAGDDGTALHRRLIDEAPPLLKPGGWLAMEVGLGQGEAVRMYAEERGYNEVSIRKDDAGIDRIVAARWDGSGETGIYEEDAA